jgi:hypothetical protein
MLGNLGASERLEVIETIGRGERIRTADLLVRTKEDKENQ